MKSPIASLFAFAILTSCASSAPGPLGESKRALITDLPASTACDDVLSCSCGTGLCAATCAASWCVGAEASTACKLCLVDTVSGCGVAFNACINPPVEPPASCCGSMPACTASTVASLCEEEEHVNDCGSSDCMTCCTETPSGCTYTAYCAIP